MSKSNKSPSKSRPTSAKRRKLIAAALAAIDRAYASKHGGIPECAAGDIMDPDYRDVLSWDHNWDRNALRKLVRAFVEGVPASSLKRIEQNVEVALERIADTERDIAEQTAKAEAARAKYAGLAAGLRDAADRFERGNLADALVIVDELVKARREVAA